MSTSVITKFTFQSLSGINAWGLNVFRASDFIVQKRVLTCVNFKIYQVPMTTVTPMMNCTKYHPFVRATRSFQERDLLDTFQIPTSTFVRFMLSVEDSYRENPYHNSFHAADVTQSTHVLLNSPNLEASNANAPAKITFSVFVFSPC